MIRGDSFGGFLQFDHVCVLFLLYNLVAETFIKYFEKYGEIIDSVIMKDRQTGLPRGFGFITYADPSVVDQVIQETHVINDKQVIIILFLFLLLL